MSRRQTDLSQPTPAAERFESIAEWLVRFGQSHEYVTLVRRLKERHRALTPAEETAVIYALIQRLRPEWCLEIGSFFGETTRIMAEAIVNAGAAGKVITLDPFGHERMPSILASWPEAERAVTDFRPWNSMQFFVELQTLRIPKGADSPLGLVFVDGDHGFEYALFDIIRSADHLAPGGVIVVDNMEQEGPKRAALQFLAWNPAWRLYHNGNLFDADTITGSTIIGGGDTQWAWGVLIAPDGIQIARQTSKMIKYGLPHHALGELIIDLRHVSHSGILSLNIFHGAVPFDYHLTGIGIMGRFSRSVTTISVGQPSASIKFSTPLMLELNRPDMNVWCEIEASYRSEESENAFLLLGAKEPVFSKVS